MPDHYPLQYKKNSEYFPDISPSAACRCPHHFGSDNTAALLLYSRRYHPCFPYIRPLFSLYLFWIFPAYQSVQFFSSHPLDQTIPKNIFLYMLYKTTAHYPKPLLSYLYAESLCSRIHQSFHLLSGAHSWQILFVHPQEAC